MAPTIHRLCLWAPCACGWHWAASQPCPFACSKAAVNARQDCRSTPGVMLQPLLCGTLQREGSGDGSVWQLLAFGTLRGRSGASEVVPAFLLCVRGRSCPGRVHQRVFVLTCIGALLWRKDGQSKLGCASIFVPPAQSAFVILPCMCSVLSDGTWDSYLYPQNSLLALCLLWALPNLLLFILHVK